MEETLVQNWNKVVKSDDHVYHLGDFCWQKTDAYIRIIKRLNGNLHLITGNHDINLTPELKKVIVEYKDYKELVDGNKKVILCHYPILFYKHSYADNAFMSCGHLHKTKEMDWMNTFVRMLRTNYSGMPDNRGQIIPVECCKPWINYTPRTLDELIKSLDSGDIYGI